MKKFIILLLYCLFSYDGNSQNYTTVTIKTPNQTAF